MTVSALTSCRVASGTEWMRRSQFGSGPASSHARTIWHSKRHPSTGTSVRLTSLAEDAEKFFFFNMQAAVVHILLLHSCTVVCNLHCLYYSHFCKLILLYVTLLFTNKLAPWYQVSWDLETYYWPIRLLDFLQLYSKVYTFTHFPFHHSILYSSPAIRVTHLDRLV